MNNNNQINSPNPSEEMGYPLIEEIDHLEDIIMSGFNFWGILKKTVVDEQAVIRQLDELRLNIPDSYSQAMEILATRDRIISDANNYAQKVVENAQRRASELLDDSRIVQQAENQAYQIKKQVQDDCENLQRKVQTDCENLQRKTMSEVEQIRKKIQQEVNQMKKQALLEADEIHREADIYSDNVLSKLERDLAEMLRIISNGRQQINQQPSRPNNPPSNMTINQKAS